MTAAVGATAGGAAPAGATTESGAAANLTAVSGSAPQLRIVDDVPTADAAPTTGAAATVAPATAPTGPPPTIAPIDPTPPTTGSGTTAAPPPAAGPTAGEPVGTSAAGPAGLGSPDGPVDPAVTPGRVHRVAAGEHFWSIAADAVSARLGRTPEDDEVVRYWMALIDANRDRLADPSDPDLIHPGLELVLPEVQPLT